jgi:hypothetical protein
MRDTRHSRKGGGDYDHPLPSYLPWLQSMKKVAGGVGHNSTGQRKKRDFNSRFPGGGWITAIHVFAEIRLTCV